MLTPELGYRLAGFTDGEGHFAVTRAKRRNHWIYSCRFLICVRDDDTASLEALQLATGLGSLYNSGPRKVGRPLAMWVVQRQAECLQIVDVFESYPLWTTKALDFAVWAQAVRYWTGDRPEGWGPMERWFQEIRDVRVYDPPMPIEVEIVESLTLFDSEEPEADG